MKVEVPIRKLAEWAQALEHILDAPEKRHVYLSERTRQVLNEILVWLVETINELEAEEK